MINSISLGMTKHLNEQIHKQKEDGDDNLLYVLKILEVGGGTGGSTVPFLNYLLDFAYRTQTKIEYTFTDISPAFFQTANEKFSKLLKDERNQQNLLNICYQVLDLNNTTNIANNESFDVILAANVLHVVMNICQSLTNLRQLLAPNGVLFLIELTSAFTYSDLIFGILPQWWASIDDSIRQPTKHAILSINQWQELFKTVGGFQSFQSTTMLVGESTILAKKSAIDTVKEEKVWLIFYDKKKEIGLTLVQYLEKQKKISNVILVSNSVTSSTDGLYHHVTVTCANDIENFLKQISKQYVKINIVYLWALDLERLTGDENNLLEIYRSQEELVCGTLMNIIKIILKQQHQQTPNIFVFTQNAQSPIISTNEYNFVESPIIGFTRTGFAEYPKHHLRLIDLQFKDNLTSCLINKIYDEISSPKQHNEVILFQHIKTIDHVIVQRYIPTLDPIKQLECEAKNIQHVGIQPNLDLHKSQFYLKVPKSRWLSDLKWIVNKTTTKDDQILKPTDVQVKIHSVGINFRDILKARGLHPHIEEIGISYEQQDGNARDEELGSDFCGTITKIGSNITDKFNVGDIVTGMTSNIGAFKSHIVINRTNIVRVSSTILTKLSMEQLSTIPSSYLTVFLAFKERMQLKQGQTVLIHSASGGVGGAAIQYCQMIGAIVLGTAGTEEKRQFLRKQYGLQHVFNSRDLSFVHQIRQLYPNGVNVILNSLSSVYLQESVKLLSSGGHFIEIGKRDIYSQTQISLFQFRQDCTFYVIDLHTYAINQPEMVSLILEEVLKLYERGQLRSIQPVDIYEPSQVINAFRIYDQANHIGKVAVRICGLTEELQAEAEEMEYSAMFTSLVCQSGTVIISGGLGGVALEMSRWMIKEKGVKRIVLMARQSQEEFELGNSYQLNDWLNLKHMFETEYENTVRVEIRKCDVTQYGQVLNLVKEINKTQYPVCGVIHAPLVLHDRLIQNMTQESLSKVMQPKIRGAWNLHQATYATQSPIHFFILLSSVRNHLRDLGGSAYNAGNQFLDALAYWRYHCKQMPALSISLPTISQVGAFHRDRKLLENQLIKEGMEILTPIIIFKLIEKLYVKQQQYSYCSPVILAVNWEILHSKGKYLPSTIVDLVDKKHFDLKINNENKNKGDGIVLSLSAVDDIDTIVNKIRLAISQIFGAITIDRIDTQMSLSEQGMDSLMAVAVYNWLEKEFNIHSSLNELLQGISIQQLAQQIFTKLTERSKLSEPIILDDDDDNARMKQTMENKILSIIDDNINDNDDEQQDTSVTLLRSLYYSKDSKQILFCFNDLITSSSSSTIFDQLLTKIKNHHYSSASVYTCHLTFDTINNFTKIDKLIQQIRYIQPRGPYYFVGYKFGSLLVYEVVKQLQQYINANVQSLILIDPIYFSKVDNGINDDKQYLIFETLNILYKYFTGEPSVHFSSTRTSHLLKYPKTEQQRIEKNLKYEILMQIQIQYPFVHDHIELLEKLLQVTSKLIQVQHNAIDKQELAQNTVVFDLSATVTQPFGQPEDFLPQPAIQFPHISSNNLNQLWLRYNQSMTNEERLDLLKIGITTTLLRRWFWPCLRLTTTTAYILEQIEFLSHIIANDQIKPSPGKIKAIIELSLP
ncbi:unnamed protein product [Didymodactylos carnosus]|uniref:oleoyl-[acyl-carrier-protein] hydrolase n=1 Tax=Didymodactylos carnosus TaxID=1234261 RepID=A0A8S2HM23_9BILA|nr:unnamed protein product [Didymodactylos carnosus]CAF3639418.1 unnamed protein product [Didymodactylos carnosus]